MGGVEWIRVDTKMFSNRKIKYIRTLQDGNDIILIWVMLLTVAGQCNESGLILLTEDIPYDAKMFADEFDFEETTVKNAFSELGKLHMLERTEHGLCITSWEEHQNAEGLDKIREKTRERVAKHREKKKLSQKQDVTLHVTHCNALEEDKEIEEDKEKKTSCKAEASALFEDLWKLYPSKKGKGQISDAKKRQLLDIGIDEFTRAINRYKADLAENTWKKTQNGSTFFNTGYIDYLDSNYADAKPVPKVQVQEDILPEEELPEEITDDEYERMMMNGEL